MTQSVVVQIGQCGNQIGLQFWQRALAEHGKFSQHGTFDESLATFFRNVDPSCNPPRPLPLGDGKTPVQSLRARAVLIDMEEGVVNSLRSGQFGELFDPAACVTSVSGSGNNWACGYFNYGARYGDQLRQAVRNAAEQCDCLQSFLLLHSMGGGTGSGLGTWTLEMLADEFPDVYRFVTPVYPSEDDDVITSPYNCVLATHQLQQFADCVMPVENQALGDIIRQIDHASKGKLKASSTIDQSASKQKAWRRMNSIVAKMLLDLTSGSRFPGSLNIDVNELTMNLVPYPQLHFLTSSMTPLYDLADVHVPPRRLDQMFTDAFAADYQLMRGDPRRGVYSACALMLRGKVEMSDVRRNIDRLKGSLRFVGWNREGWKVGLCDVASPGQDRSLLCLSNNTCVSTSFKAVRTRFNRLYSKKAFKHHFTSQGMDEARFAVVKESLSDLIEQYDHLQLESETAGDQDPPQRPIVM